MAWVERHRSALRRDYLRFAGAAGMLLVATVLVAVVHAPSARFIQKLVS
jgi:hypothetical protein